MNSQMGDPTALFFYNLLRETGVDVSRVRIYTQYEDGRDTFDNHYEYILDIDVLTRGDDTVMGYRKASVKARYAELSMFRIAIMEKEELKIGALMMTGTSNRLIIQCNIPVQSCINFYQNKELFNE